MPTALTRSFLLQAGALVIAVSVVHGLYAGLIRPRAEQVEAAQQAAQEADPGARQERSVWVIVRDPEQEICFILMLWALAIMGSKFHRVMRERGMLQRDLVPLAPGERILPEDVRDHSRALQALEPNERDSLYARALDGGLGRFRASHDLQSASQAVDAVCQAEHEQMDSELSLVRYIAWAIPSIGFIGTVRGIGQALSLAHEAVEGDISGVTASLGIAFNSTFIALVLSIVLMFVLYQLQHMQDRLVLDTQKHCDRNLIKNLQVS